MIDQKDVLGLGFVGAMVFVIALALMLLVGLPLITSDAGTLGFLGNILGARRSW